MSEVQSSHLFLLTSGHKLLPSDLPLAVLPQPKVLAAELVLLANMAFASHLASELVGLITMVIVEVILQFESASSFP